MISKKKVLFEERETKPLWQRIGMFMKLVVNVDLRTQSIKCFYAQSLTLYILELFKTRLMLTYRSIYKLVRIITSSITYITRTLQAASLMEDTMMEREHRIDLPITLSGSILYDLFGNVNMHLLQLYRICIHVYHMLNENPH